MGVTQFPGLPVTPKVTPNVGATVVGRHGTMPDTVSENFDLNQPVIGHFWYWLEVILVEAGGIEPPSEGLPPNMTTCLADVLI